MKAQIKLENKKAHVEVENVNILGAKCSCRCDVSHVFAQLISVPASRHRTRCNNNTISAVYTRDVMPGVMDQLFSSVSWWAYILGFAIIARQIIRIKFFPKSSRHDEIEYSKLYTEKIYRTFTVLPTLIIMFNKPIQETFFTAL